MNEKRRLFSRKQIDRLVGPLRHLDIQPPEGGWVRTIREALGMSVATFGEALGVSRWAARYVEQAEVDGSITLGYLRQASAVLGCDLVVAFVPRLSLDDYVWLNARNAAIRLNTLGRHDEALQNQMVYEGTVDQLEVDLAADLARRQDQRVWATVVASSPKRKSRPRTKRLGPDTSDEI